MKKYPKLLFLDIYVEEPNTNKRLSLIEERKQWYDSGGKEDYEHAICTLVMEFVSLVFIVFTLSLFSMWMYKFIMIDGTYSPNIKLFLLGVINITPFAIKDFTSYKKYVYKLKNKHDFTSLALNTFSELMIFCAIIFDICYFIY